MKSIALSLACSALLLACAPATEEDLNLELAEQAIDHGWRVTSTAAPYNSVVFVGFRPSLACAATKITATRFVTAAHCLRDVVVGGRYDMIYVPRVGDVPPITPVTVTSVARHPFYVHASGLADQTPDVGVFDVAVNATVAAIPALNVGHEFVNDGANHTFVGHGHDDFSDNDLSKQSALFTADSEADYGAFRGPAEGAEEFYHGTWTTNVLALGLGGQVMNWGDDGGPLFRSASASNRYEIAAIGVKEIDGRYSMLARGHNVAHWVLNTTQNNFVSGNFGFFFNAASMQCLANIGQSPNGAEQQFCDARLDQEMRFTLIDRGGSYFSLQNLGTFKCLTVPGNATSSGAALGQTACTADAPAQQWQFVQRAAGYVAIKNRNSGKCLAPTGLDMSDEVKQVDCSTTAANQRWIFSR